MVKVACEREAERLRVRDIDAVDRMLTLSELDTVGITEYVADTRHVCVLDGVSEARDCWAVKDGDASLDCEVDTVTELVGG